ncbi:MAG: hypothetical protein OXF79_00775 [Chloroflexi bacterium]|nr:hypothetical protein [Chloroflexota bacterium]
MIAFCDLLKILGDREEARDGSLSVSDILDQQLTAMGRNWEEVGREALRQRIVQLRSLYDWPALVAAINICPERTSRGFELVDLFNLLDMHLQSGHGFPDREKTFLPPQRLIGARGALGLLIQTMFYIDWHAKARKKRDLRHHEELAIALGRRMQNEGRRIASQGGPDDFELDDFILGDVDFVSLNWDPIGLWAQFVANRSLNGASNIPHVGTPAHRLALYHELGYFIAGPRVDKAHKGSKVWQPMNVSSARQLNDCNHGANLRIRVTNYLFPHGCLWWRECPNCGKLSSYIGDVWEIGSTSLLPPPPLRAFVDVGQFKSWCTGEEERSKWQLGEVDARACVHCKTLTYAHHTPMVMQTNFKTAPPPFLDEIQREMRVVVQQADHIVLAGYSLPSDDVTYRAFFSARTRRNSSGLKDSNREVRCSVVDLDDRYGDGWIYPAEIQAKGKSPETVKNAQDAFGRENVRFFGGGVPGVFLDGNARVSASAVERFLLWDRA